MLFTDNTVKHNVQRKKSLVVKRLVSVSLESRPEFRSRRFSAERHISGCNRAFNNPDYRAQLWSDDECSHALHIRVDHFLLRHISIRRIRLRDAKLGNLSILSSFIRWRTDYWCCRSGGGARWYWGKLDISP